uniref:Ras-associating domain-containing protein n=2 Tax=Micrurus TaxID=8634 RepID=A0A2D4K6P7_9SAUR
MELKVWVDGVQRVVCGVSDQTTCQEVVIALARAIGQTGRYVLIQRLREKERQFLPHECPVEFLSKCGQYAQDVQFILQRTGPSLIERPSSDNAAQIPERTFVRASLPIKPRPLSTEVPRTRQPKKSLTFNLGPGSSGDACAKNKMRQPRKDPTCVRDGARGGLLSKEELFKTVLYQQEHLYTLEMQGDALEMDIRHWECSQGSRQEDEILQLEQLVHQNESQLSEEEFWQNELQSEKEHERERREKVHSLRATMEEYTKKIHELTVKTETLEREIQWEIAERAKKTKETSTQNPTELIGMSAKIKRDLESKAKQTTQLESSLDTVGRALEEAEYNLQAQNQELEELNKELRQCNLQQFIQQTGAMVTTPQARSEAESQLDQISQELPTHQRNGDLLELSRNSPPRPTAKHFLRNPRNLQNPLVSSLNPEVVSAKQSIWR